MFAFRFYREEVAQFLLQCHPDWLFAKRELVNHEQYHLQKEDPSQKARDDRKKITTTPFF
jgi:hypothetical protein